MSEVSSAQRRSRAGADLRPAIGTASAAGPVPGLPVVSPGVPVRRQLAGTAVVVAGVAPVAARGDRCAGPGPGLFAVGDTGAAGAAARRAGGSAGRTAGRPAGSRGGRTGAELVLHTPLRAPGGRPSRPAPRVGRLPHRCRRGELGGGSRGPPHGGGGA